MIKSKLSKTQKHSGFTLIEVLVVISIIGILATIGFNFFRTAQASARDGKRQADLERIRSTLAIYRRDNGVYPDSLDLDSEYGEIPQDPTPDTYSYAYSGSGQNYTLCAHLERGTTEVEPICSGIGSCGNGVCNYGVRAP